MGGGQAQSGSQETQVLVYAWLTWDLACQSLTHDL